MGEFETLVEEIAEHGLLTEKQAAAYLGREIGMNSREQVAAYLDIAPSTLDNHLHRARVKVEAAEETLEILDEYEQRRYPPVPDNCDKCDSPITGPFITTDEGGVLCADCADVDVDAL